MTSLRSTIDSLIYFSVALGVILLPQLYGIVPSWLFFSVLAGWLAYLGVAILAARGRSIAYPLDLILAVFTLAVSLPQPEHQSFVETGLSLASITFLGGSVVQLLLIILISIYFWRNRTRRNQLLSR